MPSEWGVTGPGVQQLAKLRTRLSAVASSNGSQTIAANVNRRVSPLTRAVVSQVRTAAMNTPSNGSRHTGLRRAIANTVIYKVTVSGRVVTVVIYSDASKMGGGSVNMLPQMLEGVLPWHHPTFGHRPMESQDASPWFRPTVNAAVGRYRNELRAVMSDVRNYLATGS